MIGKLLGHPRLVVALVLALTVPLGVCASRLETDNTLPAWLPPDDPQLQAYQRFRAVFGEDQFVLVALDEVNTADEGLRRAVGAFATSLRARPDVATVVAPWDEAGAPGPGLGGGHLVSADGRMAALLVVPRAELSAPARSVFVSGLLEQLPRAPGRPLLCGPEAINHALDEGSRSSFGVLFPIAVAVVSAVVAFSLRSWRAVAAIALGAGVACAWTLGALQLAGRSLNLVVVVIPALLFVVGTAYALHVVSRFLSEPAPLPEAWSPEARRAAWARATRSVLAPALFTALTTAAGFSSLAAAGLPPLRDLGLFAALGVLFSFVLAVGFVPALLSLSGRFRPRGPALGADDAPAAQGAADSPWGRYAAWLEPRAGRVVLACLLLVGGVGLGIKDLRVESHVLRYLSPAHPLVRATAAVEARLLGLTPLEVWVRGPVARVATAEAVSALRALPAAVADPDVLRVVSPLDLDPSLATRAPEAVSRELRLALARNLLPAAAASHLRRLPSGELAVRVTLLCRTTSSERSAALAERLRGRIAATLPADLQPELTGAIPILVELQAVLLRAQVTSFAASLGMVSGLLLLWLRAPALVALSLVPNALPIALTLGGMGLVGLPLDLATVTVAGIAFGLVVDDTIHLLHAWRHARDAGAAPRVAVARMLGEVGRPVLVTSAALTAGFLTFAVAPFRPTRDFGLLTAGTATGALLLDLLLTPSLLLLLSRHLGSRPAPAQTARPVEVHA